MGCPPELATKNDSYMALAYTVRDRLLANWVQTLKHLKEDVKVVSYLSTEFLLGPELNRHCDASYAKESRRSELSLFNFYYLATAHFHIDHHLYSGL